MKKSVASALVLCFLASAAVALNIATSPATKTAAHKPAALAGCEVIGVSDGDSMKVRCPDREAVISVRLGGVDAPEIEHKALHIAEQPWGREAKAALSALCLKKPATVQPITTDRYGRMVADVECAGIPAGAEQIRMGNAWAFMTTRGSVLPALEREARAKRLGLWSLPSPVAPSQWRHK